MIVNPHDSTKTYVYDAWNRMVRADVRSLTGTTMVASYEYDGRGFRIEQSVPGKSAPVVTHDYHNDNWQVIEQRVGSSTAARAQFVWSAAYVDALVQEQRDTDANGSLDRTLYATHDANFNVTAAVTLGGIAQQRFLYDAYGARSVLTADWQPTTSAAILDHGHQGGRSDAATGFILFRHRYLSPGLMRWTSRDPAGYVDGGSLYEGYSGTPLGVLDPQGLLPKYGDRTVINGVEYVYTRPPPYLGYGAPGGWERAEQTAPAEGSSHEGGTLLGDLSPMRTGDPFWDIWETNYERGRSCNITHLEFGQYVRGLQATSDLDGAAERDAHLKFASDLRTQRGTAGEKRALRHAGKGHVNTFDRDGLQAYPRIGGLSAKWQAMAEATFVCGDDRASAHWQVRMRIEMDVYDTWHFGPVIAQLLFRDVHVNLNPDSPYFGAQSHQEFNWHVFYRLRKDFRVAITAE